MQLPKSSKEFRSMYLLKEQLVEICKNYNLPHTGSKGQLSQYISDFMDGKSVRVNPKETKKKSEHKILHLDLLIDKNYSNDENHRDFFLNVIGATFKYNVEFMNWMKENSGKKTYKQAVEKWKEINERKKKGEKKEIGKQFKYNQYTRDFFLNNPNLTKKDCIKCWNYKKTIAGNHKYEKEDLQILSKQPQ
ncbi:MAG: hypothetical protein IT310_08480 [Anaerolineales bacterium]|nr:hypothetical protein [Anaerolineales bacterium]